MLVHDLPHFAREVPVICLLRTDRSERCGDPRRYILRRIFGDHAEALSADLPPAGMFDKMPSQIRFAISFASAGVIFSRRYRAIKRCAASF
jgi:hypothetical protein